jgi:uncharacterized protein DUF4241
MRTLKDPLTAVVAVVVLAALLGALQLRPPEQRKPPKPAKPYPGRAATLPPAVDVIDEPHGFVATRDVVPGELKLPSGRLAIDAYFSGDTRPLRQRVAPGSYPFHVTEAKPVDGSVGGGVALATLVVSERPTVRWEPAGGIGVDGGEAAFSSAGGARDLGTDMPDSALDRQQDFDDVMTAHRASVGLAKVGDHTNIAVFETGLGDGGYGIYVGLDAAGEPTQFVLDCGLIHFDWPKPEAQAKAGPA